MFLGPQGCGKGTIATILELGIGTENSSIIKQRQLKSRFNSQWATKLLLVADEVGQNAAESAPEFLNDMKSMVTDKDTWLEAKGMNAVCVSKRYAFVVLSNSAAPFSLEQDDRRWTVFANFEDLTPEYKQMLSGMYDQKRQELTQASLEEVSHFVYDLLRVQVDTDRQAYPCHTVAKEVLQRAHKTPTDSFFDRLRSDGIGAYENLFEFDSSENTPREVEPHTGIYRYDDLCRLYCAVLKRQSAQPLKDSKFPDALARAGWTKHQYGPESRRKRGWLAPKEMRDVTTPS
jgi:hypothetical protein